MKVIYIAAPFSAETEWERSENVQMARRHGLEVARLGAMPLLPTANTSLFWGQCNPGFWYLGTLELLRRCDAIYLCPGWLNSRGCVREWELARKMGLPIFSSSSALRDLGTYLAAQAGDENASQTQQEAAGDVQGGR
jgi:hypothetical protein